MEICDYIRLSIYNYFKIDFDTRSRERKHYYLRALYFKLCRKNTGLGLREIGETLNNQFTHATVINAIEKFDHTISSYEPKIMEFYKGFEIMRTPTVKRVDLLKGIVEI